MADADDTLPQEVAGSDWSIPGAVASNAPPQPKTGEPSLRPESAEPFDPDAFVGKPQQEAFNPDSFLKQGMTPAVPAAPQYDIHIGDTPKDQFDPDEFLASADALIQKRIVAKPVDIAQKSMLGILGGPENALNAEGRNIVGSIGSAVQYAGSLLSQLDSSVDPADDTTNPYILPGLTIRGAANLNYPEDPTRTTSSTVGNIAGSVLPVAVTGGAAAVPRASVGLLGLGAKAIGSGMFAGQMYAGAADAGANPELSNLAGGAGAVLGLGLPLTNAFHASPAIASATWSGLAKNTAFGVLNNASKTYWEMAGINQVSGEISNAVLPTDQQQTQSQIAYNSLAQALPMAFVGAAAHGIGQINAESDVSKLAADNYGQEGGSVGPAQDKASFIVNTTKSMSDIANNKSLTPQQKQAAVTTFLSGFKPSAQGALVAHVQNVQDTINSINASANAAEKLAQTNPVTAPALAKEQTDAAVQKMQNNATSIEADAADADAKEEEALKAVPEPVEEPIKETEPDPAVATPEATEPETPAHIIALLNSPDPDIAARAKQIVDARAQAAQEHATTDSPAQKQVLEQEIAAHDTALQNLANHPAETPELEPEFPKIQTATDTQLDENEANADKWIADPESTPEDLKFWQGAKDAITAERARRQAESVKEQPHILSYDEYGNEQRIPIQGTEAAPEVTISPKESNVQEQTKAEPATTEPEPSKESPVEQSVPAEQEGAPKVEGAPDVAEPTEPEEKPVTQTPLKDLGKEDLVKVAKAEGHSDQDIADTKSPKALRDLIDAKRIVRGAPEEPVRDKKSGYLVDPKIAKLPDKYRKAVESFLATAAKTGFKRVKFVLHDRDRVAVDPRNENLDTVFINPIELAHEADYIKGKTGYKKGDLDFLHDKIFNEEFTHLHAARVLHDEWTATGSQGSFGDYYQKRMAEIYDQMSPSERDSTKSDYGGDLANIDTSKSSTEHGDNNTAASRIAEEFFRKVIQRRSGKGVTEDAIKKLRSNKPMRRLLQNVVDRFNGILAKLIETGKSSSALESLVRDYQKALDESGTKKVSKKASFKATSTPAAPIRSNESEGEEVRPEDIQAKIAKHLADENKRVQANRNENSSGTVLGRDQDLRSDLKILHSISKDGDGTPEQFGDDLRKSLSDQNVKGAQKLLDYAIEKKRLIPTRDFKALDPHEIEGGAEHQVYVLPSANVVIKKTRGTKFGIEGTLSAYIDRIKKQNAIAPGLDIKLQGFTPDERTSFPQAVTSMKYIMGRHPSDRELHEELTNRYGFTSKGPLGAYHYIHPSGVEIFDAHGRNFLKTPRGNYTDAERAEIVAKPRNFPDAKWDYTPIDIGVRGNPEKPMFGTGEESKLAPAASIRPEEEDEDTIWYGHYEPPATDPKEALKDIGYPPKTDVNSLNPFTDTPNAEAANGPNQKLKAVRGLGEEVGNSKEQTIERKIEALKHVDIPQDQIERIQKMAQKQADLHFGANRGNKDIADGNAFVKTLLEAKKWMEQKGSLDGFGAYRVIRNSLLDDGRKFARGERPASAVEEPEKATATETDEDGNPIETTAKPKGYDASNQEYEAQQAQFEPTGGQGDEIATNDNPSKVAQNKEVEANIKAVTDAISPYGRRLLEIKSDTPDDPYAAFEPWVNKAAKEFGVPRAKIMSDMDAITDHVRQEVDARGLNQQDFVRTPAASIRQHGLTEQASNDERLPEDIRSLMATRVYEQKSNQATNDSANTFIAKHGDAVAYQMTLDTLANGKPDATTVMVGMKLGQKLLTSNDGVNKYRGEIMLQNVANEMTRSGQIGQIARAWAMLGSNGALAAYDKIIRPVVDAVKAPFKPTTDAIENVINTGKEGAVDETVDRFEKNGLFNKYETLDEKMAREKAESETPIWQRYMESTASALSKLGEKAAPKVKGALDEFASRMQQNFKARMEEEIEKKPTVKLPAISAEAKLSEIYKNEPEYKEAWEFAKSYIEAKYADHPDVLKLFEGTLNEAFKVPVKLHDASVKREVENRGYNFRQIAKNFPDASGLRDSVASDITSRMGLKDEQAEGLKSDLAASFDRQLKNAHTQNEGAAARAKQIKEAKEASLKQGIPLWQRYTDQISGQLAKMVDSKPPSIKPAMQEFASRVASNLKALVNEGRVDSALSKTSLTADQRFGEIYRNFPEYQKAWDEARNAMRAKIGNDPVKQKEFEKSLQETLRAPVALTDKVLNSALKVSDVKVSDLVKEWSGTQNATRDALIKSIQDRMTGLTPEQSQKLGDAVYSRFNERLQAAKKAEVTKIMRKSNSNKVANSAPELSDKIFKAVNLGATADEATWNAIADKLKLPKYDPKVAADLSARANEIQKMIADGKEGKQTDDKTQNMMNMLADEAQKHMGVLRQIGQGELAVFYGNIFGPSTVARKSISEVTNLLAEVGTMAAAEMRHGDAFAILRAYGAAMRGLYQRGGMDMRSILATGRGARQGSGDYQANNLVERGKIFGDVPGLSLLNKPLSVLYKPVGRVLYGAQAFFYAGNAEARANMIAYRLAKQEYKEGKLPSDVSISQRTSEILGNSPEMRDKFQAQAAAEGLKGRDAAMRSQELAEQQQPQELRDSAHDFASKATFMQEPEGVLGVAYKMMQYGTNKMPALRLLIPVTRVVSNVFNNFLSYTPVGISGAVRLGREGKSDEMYQQLAKVTLGGLSTAAMATLFGSNVQGSGPKDPDKRKQLMDAGWIPYSVKVGNKYYSYREWPTALMMAGIGSYYDQGKFGEGGNPDTAQRLAVATMMTGKFALTSSWISSVNNLLATFDAQSPGSFETHLKNLAGTTAGALVPFNQKTIQMIDSIFNPEQYPPNTIAGILMSKVAIARQFDNGNQPAINALGDPLETNPIQTFYSSASSDSVWSSLAKMEAFVPTPSKSTYINGRTITGDELYDLIKQTGQMTKTDLENGGLDAMSAMDKGQAQEYLERVYRANLMQVKAQLQRDAIDSGEAPSAKKAHHK